VSSDLLLDVDLFASLDNAEREQLAAIGHRLTVAKRQTVFRHGDPATGFYVILKGSVVVYRDAIGQPMQRLASLEAGDHFGELALFGEGTRNASVRAVEDCILMLFRRDELMAFVKEHPSFALRLQIAAARRRSQHSAAALDLAHSRDVRIRLSAAGELVEPGGRRRAIVLENLSQGGLCLAGAPIRWDLGDDVSFELTFGEALGFAGRGRVVWRESDQVGLEFVDPPADLEPRVRRLVHKLLSR